MTTSSKRRSGSFQVSKFETSSAPVMKYQSLPASRSLRISTVSTLCIGRPASTSTRSTKNRSLPATAASTMSKRSSAEARTLEASLCGGMPPGTNTTRERSSSSMTCSAMTMCPWCTGSKVPPKIPTFMATSSEIEDRLANPDLVARRRARPAQGTQDAPLFELPLEVLYALRALPVRLERQPLDALAGDHVAAVLLLHPHPLPRRAEHPVAGFLSVRGGRGSDALLHCTQALFHEVPELLHAFAGPRGDLQGPRERVPQVLLEFIVQEVHLVQNGERRLPGEPRGVQFRPEDTLGLLRILARVQDDRQEPCPRHVPQETVAQAPALARTRDETGDVRDHEGFPVASLVHDPELRRQRGEGVVAHPRTGGAQCRQQRGLAGIRQAHQAHVRENLQFQMDLAFLPRQAPLAKRRRLARRGRERRVPPAALTAAGHDEGVLRLGEVGE